MSTTSRKTGVYATAIVLIFASLYFFFSAVGFLAEKDYVAGGLSIFVGFCLVRSGIEAQKILIFARGEDP